MTLSNFYYLNDPETNKMKFFTSPSSPFGRKVKIAAHVLGLHDDLVEFPINTLDPASGICDVNPLGKIPALEDNGSTLYDKSCDHGIS